MLIFIMKLIMKTWIYELCFNSEVSRLGEVKIRAKMINCKVHKSLCEMK